MFVMYTVYIYICYGYFYVKDKEGEGEVKVSSRSICAANCVAGNSLQINVKVWVFD